MKNKKIFLKAFFITLAISGVLAALLLVKIPTNEDKNASSKQSSFVPAETQKRTLLITLSQNENEPAHAYFMLCFNPENQNVGVTRLFSQTLLSGANEPKVILGERYRESGISGAIEALNSYFNCDISKYISLTNKSAVGLFQKLNPALVNIKHPLSQVDKQKDIYIKIDSGNQLLSSTALVDFFACTAFRGGVSETLFETANALCSLLNRNSEIFSLKNSGEAEKYILSECHTNLTALDFEKNREIMSYIFKNPNAALVVAADGEYKNEETEFRLESASINNIRDFCSK